MYFVTHTDVVLYNFCRSNAIKDRSHLWGGEVTILIPTTRGCGWRKLLNNLLKTPE